MNQLEIVQIIEEIQLQRKRFGCTHINILQNNYEGDIVDDQPKFIAIGWQIVDVCRGSLIMLTHAS